MKKALLAALLVAAPLQMHAQQKNAVFVEIGGSAAIYSLNYERRLSQSVFGRAGFELIQGKTHEDTESTWVVPLTMSWVSHPQLKHHLELGGGLTIVSGDRQDLLATRDDDEKITSGFGSAIVGYRYNADNGFQLRLVTTPLIGQGELQPWWGISFGYAW